MKPLSLNDIESELSYSYLHAVVSKAGASCKITNRHEDNRGIDAQITAWSPFANGGYLEEIDIKIQLKATTSELKIKDGCITYFLDETKRYDDLRMPNLSIPRFLVVMFLPKNEVDWLKISTDELVMKKCAYWVSLRNAPESTNTSGQTVYIPETQIFNPESLMDICSKLSRNEKIDYQPR
jgi:hypothetical protein